MALKSSGHTILVILGILLLAGVGILGLRTFVERYREKELIPLPAGLTQDKKNGDVTKVEFDKAKYPTDKADSIWVVVNKNRPLDPLQYSPNDLADIGNTYELRQEAATAFRNLVDGAKADGYIIGPFSGYRSYTMQDTVYKREVAQKGQEVADRETARPGYSEHQTGLAVDIGGGGCGIEDCFGDTDEGKWVAKNAYKYGFILRYIAGKEDVTGYRAEPWHIRYIGTELSMEMHSQNITTLEEFFGI